MRKIKTPGRWLIDIMLFERDSNSLHLFSLVVVRGGEPSRMWIKTPDFRVPMPIKAIPVPMPKVLREAMKILKIKAVR